MHRALTMLLVFASALSLADDVQARLNYTLHCRGCHLADGRGAPEAVPDFSVNMAHYLHTEGGREYVVQVPGAANAPLSDEQLADVINWIYGNLPVGEIVGEYQPFSSEEVASYRQIPLVNVQESRKVLLQRIRENQ